MEQSTGRSLSDSLGPFLLYVVFVNPVCAWIVRGGGPPLFAAGKPTWSRAWGKRLAILFIICVGIVSHSSQGRPPNLYATVGVPRATVLTAWTATTRGEHVPPAVAAARKAMKAAYRANILATHPDKCVSANGVRCNAAALKAANDRTMLLQYAFDVLRDPVLRRAYDADGFLGVGRREKLRKQWNSVADEVEAKEESERIWSMGITYAAMLAQAYVFTSPFLLPASKRVREKCRSYLFSTVVLAMILDALLGFTSAGERGGALFAHATPFMKIALLRALLPSLFSACRVVADANASDESSAEVTLFREVHAHISQMGEAHARTVAVLNAKLDALLRRLPPATGEHAAEAGSAVQSAAGDAAGDAALGAGEGSAASDALGEEGASGDAAGATATAALPICVRLPDGSTTVVTISKEQLAPLVAAAVAAEGSSGGGGGVPPATAAVPAPAPPGGVIGVLGAVPRSVWVFAVIGLVQYGVQQL